MKFTDMKTEKLEQTIDELRTLLIQKRQAYGNAFNDAPKILECLYPEGISPEQYSDVLTLIRMLDKMHRIANQADTEDPWQDIAGYAILALEKQNS